MECVSDIVLLYIIVRPKSRSITQIDWNYNKMRSKTEKRHKIYSGSALTSLRPLYITLLDDVEENTMRYSLNFSLFSHTFTQLFSKYTLNDDLDCLGMLEFGFQCYSNSQSAKSPFQMTLGGSIYRQKFLQKPGWIGATWWSFLHFRA